MEQIVNKKAYWGEYVFEATKDTLKENSVRLDIYRGFPSFARKHEATFFIENREQLLQLADDQTSSLRFYVGQYFGGCERVTFKAKKIQPRTKREVEVTDSKYVQRIDLFLQAFKHNLID